MTQATATSAAIVDGIEGNTVERIAVSETGAVRWEIERAGGGCRLVLESENAEVAAFVLAVLAARTGGHG